MDPSGLANGLSTRRGSSGWADRRLWPRDEDIMVSVVCCGLWLLFLFLKIVRDSCMEWFASPSIVLLSPTMFFDLRFVSLLAVAMRLERVV